MSNLQSFSFCDLNVRTVVQDNEPLFCLKDVAECLGLENRHNLSARLDEDEKVLQNIETLGGVQKTTFVTESGLYSVIMSCQSSNPKVKEFKRWVTKEVLPAIRKNGFYATELTTLDMFENTDAYMKVLNDHLELLKKFRHEREIRQIKEKETLLLQRELSVTNAEKTELQIQFDKAKEWWTVRGLEKFLKMKLTRLQGQTLGRGLAKKGRAMRIAPKEVQDALYGVVYSHHISVIKEYDIELYDNLIKAIESQ